MIGTRALLAAVLTLAIVAIVPPLAQATETAKLKVAFSPYKLGQDTTITASFDIANTNGELPAPPTKFDLRFPASLSALSSNLGLAICQPAALVASGLEGCPPNAQIGGGHALVVVPIGPEAVQEEASLTALMGPAQGEEAGVLLYADGQTPVSAQILFQGDLLAGTSAFGELLETNLPLIPSVPGARDAAVTKMDLSVDPGGLTYYKRVRGKNVGYHPRGFELPATCPAGGFQFTVSVSFADGTTAPAVSTIPCPSSPHKHHRRR